MKRALKFRGIKVGTKSEWVYGGYFEDSDEDGLKHMIFTNRDGAVEVYDHTIGQFSGIEDKDKKEIYEDDVIQFGRGAECVVNFENGSFSIFNEPLGWDFEGWDKPHLASFENCSIIGNAHDNPELIKNERNV